MTDFSRLTQKEVAEALDVTSRTIRDWADEGFPRNADGSYALKACIAWLLARSTPEGLDLDQERARLAKEQADKHSLENAVRRGTLLEVEMVSKVWTGIFTALRARVLSLPTKVAAELAALTDATRIRDRLTDEAHQILSEAASYRPDDAAGYSRPADQADDVDPEATAPVNGKRVGGRRKAAQPRE